VIYYLHRRLAPEGRIVCCATTGKAARVLEQSTGMPATTAHKVLGLYADENGKWGEPETLLAKLVVVDEASMLDMFIAEKLIRSVPNDAMLVLVGDADQLPSVGPGAVLKDVILSRCVPVTKLDVILRQEEGNSITENAWRIIRGNSELVWGKEFAFLETKKDQNAAECLTNVYVEYVNKYGADNVLLLTPYRRKTDTGVNAINQRIQNEINPPVKGKPEVLIANRCFRLGDKVMQNCNWGSVNNGDVGFITNISGSSETPVVRVNFGTEKNTDYVGGDLEMLELAYACTVHKAQGDAYENVIINIQPDHSGMLNRSLLYTAVTRAKSRVLFVGDYETCINSIKKKYTNWRRTKLARRLAELSRNTPYR